MPLPDDWYVEHDGQSRVLDYNKVEAEFERLMAENVNLRAAMDSIRVIVNAARELSR